MIDARRWIGPWRVPAPTFILDALGRIEFTVNNAPLRQFEAPKYLPLGYGSRTGGLPDYENDPVPDVQTISCKPPLSSAERNNCHSAS